MTEESRPRTRCEVYSRVVGFLSPVSQWNRGKKAEWPDRTTWDGAGGVVNKSLTTEPTVKDFLTLGDER